MVVLIPLLNIIKKKEIVGRRCHSDIKLGVNGSERSFSSPVVNVSLNLLPFPCLSIIFFLLFFFLCGRSMYYNETIKSISIVRQANQNEWRKQFTHPWKRKEKKCFMSAPWKSKGRWFMRRSLIEKSFRLKCFHLKLLLLFMWTTPCPPLVHLLPLPTL